ncbi:MAG: hypothetical protein UV28_C0008G0012 [Candidatus Collierbacteria bacterium GW2011_GWE2_42_48]|nr:MAG: hypothetical protein UV28_C0008G0012 [Candidatus Collierbacteria bacterium GW2011_GWE2_42_48]
MKIYIIINLIFSVLFGFGVISRGALKQVIIALGGLGLIITTATSFFSLGFKSGLIVGVLTLLVVMPVSGFLSGLLNEMIYKR